MSEDSQRIRICESAGGVQAGLFYIGAAGLLIAIAADALAVLGPPHRHPAARLDRNDAGGDTAGLLRGYRAGDGRK